MKVNGPMASNRESENKSNLMESSMLVTGCREGNMDMELSVFLISSTFLAILSAESKMEREIKSLKMEIPM